jgi:hypothetical protein
VDARLTERPGWNWYDVEKKMADEFHDDCFMGTGKHGGEETAVLPHSCVDKGPVLGEANDESLKS